MPPFGRPKKSAQTMRRDPFTGRQVVPPPLPGEGPEVDISRVPLAGPLAAVERDELLTARLRDRGRRADAQLRKEHEKFAYDAKAHPVRRLRLQHRRGPLSVDDLAALSAVSARTIQRIEAGEGGSVGDLAFHALATALGVRRDQVDPTWTKR